MIVSWAKRVAELENTLKKAEAQRDDAREYAALEDARRIQLEFDVAQLTEQRAVISAKYTEWMERALAAEAAVQHPWHCVSLPKGTFAIGAAGANCKHWPKCGCDPYANRVIGAINVSGGWRPAEAWPEPQALDTEIIPDEGFGVGTQAPISGDAA